jgi:hypothetical protein
VLVNERGFSVAEITATLLVLSLLTSVATPAINDYVEQAKLVRARSDVATLSVSLFRLIDDVGFERNRPGGWGSFELLVSPGSPPVAGGEASSAWAQPVPDAAVGLLDDQLVRNTAGYMRFNRTGWRGPYLQSTVRSDPWGTRYGVNIGAMKRPDRATFVLSAGADGIVSVPFDADGLPAGDDDIVAVVATAGVR